MDRLHLLVFLVTLSSSAFYTEGYVNQPCVLQLHKNEIQNKQYHVEKWIRRENVTLIYVHLKSNISRSRILQDSPQLKNRLMQWLLVAKSEKHLAQLPVDIDIVTFNLFENTGEQKHVDISATLENEYCAFTEKSVENAKQMLWSTLFTNHSENFLLCNRRFKSDWLREGIYWVTTVWNGYDLNCTAKYDDEVFDVGKTNRLNVIPVFCFILAIQYVWLFRLLEMKPDSNRAPDTNERGNSKRNCGLKWETMPYKENDRPYGIKRIFQKILFTKLNSSKTWITGMFNLPSARLIGFLYFVVVLPTNLYNIVYRYKISKTQGDTYLNILKPVEPLCSLIECSYRAHQCDLGFSIVSVILGVVSAVHKYETFSGKRFWLDPNEEQSLSFVRNTYKCIEYITSKITDDAKKQSEPETSGARDTEMQSEPETSGARDTEMQSEPETSGARDTEMQSEPETSGARDTEIQSEPKSPDRKMWFSVILFFFLILPLFVLSLVIVGVAFVLFVLVLIFLACGIYVCYCCHIRLKACPDKDNEDSCTAWLKCNNSLPIRNCFREDNPKTAQTDCIFTCISLILLICCQRSILSGLTFFFREITYLLFVILPARIDLFRYFLIFLTAVIHMGKYYSELVNMSTEILHEMFIQANGDEKELPEEKFSDVMKKLEFSRRFYLFLFKCLVVFSYIFITVEALLSSQKLKSSRHFENFISFIFIALSPSAVSFIYSKYKDQYLTEGQKTKIKEIVRNEDKDTTPNSGDGEHASLLS